MRLRLPIFGLPMLAKDLAEMAQHRRTYVVRVAFALLTFIMSAILFVPTYRAARWSPGGLLGQGEMLLNILYVIETVGLWLFVPAIASGALTAEKERNMLQLLFITKLGPWTILIEKLLSRLVPIATFLLISSPLLLVGYLMGGLTPADLELAAIGLAITAFEVACFSLFCSAYCATTASAFVATYVTMAGVFFAPYLVIATLTAIDSEYRELTGHRAAFFTLFDPPQGQAGIAMAAASTQGLSADLLFQERTAPGPLRPFHRHPFPLCVMSFCGIGFLLLARWAIVSRAAPQPSYWLRGLFRRLDAIWKRINDQVARGILIGRSREDLPDYRPVAWRERRRGNLGQFSDFVRILLLLEVPILLYTVLYLRIARSNIATREYAYGAFVIPGTVLWSIALLVVFVRSAGLIAAEKARQTLDVLVSTPLSLSALVGDKLRGLRRAMVVVAVPIFLQAMIVDTVHSPGGPLGLMTVINLLVLLNLAAQLAFLCGLRAQTQGRAVVLAMSVFVAWSALPVIARIFLNTAPWTLYFSPLGGLLVTQFPPLGVSAGMFRRLYYPVPQLLPHLWMGDGIAGFYLLIHGVIYSIVIAFMGWLNHDLARRILVRPRGFSRAPTHHVGLFLED
jgi:ABC-type transport system involved in multi-copper enzyme maturation permease subunit